MPTTKKDSKPKKAVKKSTKSKKESKPKVSKKTTTVVKETSAVVEETSAVVEETSAVVEETSAVIEESVVSSEKFLKDFDWENFEEGIETVDEKQLVELENLIKENFVDTYNDSVIEGTIINLTRNKTIIN